jgi:glutamate-1-semialdehyde aminotransferase
MSWSAGRPIFLGFLIAHSSPPCCLIAFLADTAKFGKFHRGMLEQGVYLAPSQFEAGFTSLAHTEEDVDFTIEAARTVLKSL